MSLHYLDTSALVKRYVPEQGSAWVQTLCSSEDVAISLLAIVELASALARRTRAGDLAESDRDTIFLSFLSDVNEYHMLGVTEAIARQGAVLLLTSPPNVRIRSLDALHLATAQLSFTRAREQGIATGQFVTADQDLIDAAQWTGLVTTNPEGYP